MNVVIFKGEIWLLKKNDLAQYHKCFIVYEKQNIFSDMEMYETCNPLLDVSIKIRYD